MSPSNRFTLNAVACAASEAIEVYSNCLRKGVAGPMMKGATPAVKATIGGTLSAQDLPDGPLLVIDDLVESGAALAAAARALRAAGPASCRTSLPSSSTDHSRSREPVHENPTAPRAGIRARWLLLNRRSADRATKCRAQARRPGDSQA